MLKKIFAVWVLLMPLMILMAHAEQVTWSDLQKNIGSWIEGPVSLIVTDQEMGVWKKLKAPEDQMQFIKIFWARRDPILRTSENEFKTEFYKRLDYANQEFAEGNNPGWKTARGKVYIVFGPPGRIDHQSVEGSSRPALLWVYDKNLGPSIPPNEAMMFVYHEFKYVLAPPNAQPGDRISAEQRNIDSGFRYQDIPTSVQRAFADVAKADVIDEKKNYEGLVFSVKSTEKFQIAEIPFEIRTGAGGAQEVSIKHDDAPVYDDGNRVFAEFYVKQELKKGDSVVTTGEETKSYTWTSADFANLKEIVIPLKKLEAASGEYELSVTVQDRISNVGETRKSNVAY